MGDKLLELLLFWAVLMVLLVFLTILGVHVFLE